MARTNLQLTREEIIDIILEATTREQINSAWGLANTWNRNNPKDLSVRQACEQLLVIEQALDILENET